MAKIIGREKEIKLLNELYESEDPHFVVVYGRRRVGKTFLVRETFQNAFAFYSTGINQRSKKKQLESFYQSLCRYSDLPVDFPQNWLQAFASLVKILEKKSGKKVIFLDELSWMDTQNSDFISGIEWFWNSWASARSDIMLIVCSSATSWIVKKIFRNHGGLYGRITRKIHLTAFTLAEAEDYFKANNMKMSRFEQLQCYMIMGGIPYYLSLLDSRLSLAQNIDNLFFAADGQLFNEYNDLYASLFHNPENYIAVVEAIGKKSQGLTRNEILEETKMPNAGSTTRILEDLASCDFIRSYNAFGKKGRESLYQLIDFYTLFYFNFLKTEAGNDPDFWLNHVNTPRINTWSGYAFEQVCLAHSYQIKKALGISGIATNISSWKSKQTENNAQIDLVIDRADNVINITEIKYSTKPYVIDKNYNNVLQNKIWSFEEESKTKKTVRLLMISTFGIKKNEYSANINNELLLDDLF